MSPSLSKSFSSFDESATLATLSTLSMSSSEDSSQDHLESHSTNTNSINSASSNSNSTSSNKSKGGTQSGNKSRNNRNKGRNNKKNKNTNAPRKSKATSTKTHDAPMKRRDIYFALDCEMVGVGPEAVDSALARVSVVNWDNEIVLDTYVKVDEPVTDYRTFVSGITPEQIKSDSALPLSEVRRIVTSTLQGKILIGHGLVNDLKVMGINHPWCDIRDTATYAPFMRTIESRSVEEQTALCPRKLRDLVSEKLGKHIQIMGKAHSPVEDAIAAMDLYKAVRNEWEMEMMRKVNQANKATNDNVPRVPFVRRLPRKVTVSEMGSMPLFPATQYPAPPLSYIPFQGFGQNVGSSHYQSQLASQSLHHARLAQEHTAMSRVAAAFAYNQQQQMMRHC